MSNSQQNLNVDWSPILTRERHIWVNRDRVAHAGLDMLTLSGTPNFIPFGEFMILLIRYIYMILLDYGAASITCQNRHNYKCGMMPHKEGDADGL